MSHKKLIIIDNENRITRNNVSSYELASSTAIAMKIIQNTFKVPLPPNMLLINTNDLSDDKKKNIDNKLIFEEGGKSYVKLTSTSDIARACINNNSYPLIIYRIIQEDKENKLLYAEKIDFNSLNKDFLPYLQNLGY